MEYKYIQKELEDVILGNREAVKPLSKIHQNESTQARIKKLQDKESNKSLTTEEATELFELALGVEQQEKEQN